MAACGAATSGQAAQDPCEGGWRRTLTTVMASCRWKASLGGDGRGHDLPMTGHADSTPGIARQRHNHVAMRALLRGDSLLQNTNPDTVLVNVQNGFPTFHGLDRDQTRAMSFDDTRH